MILADTSIWVDHLRSGDSRLARLLADREILAHTWVSGELALGNLRNADVLILLDQLPRAAVATDNEIRRLIAQENLAGSGIGYVDVQLLAAVRLTPNATLWTRDRRLATVSRRLGIHEPAS